jgi:outer membrane protein, multidrug efflux system
MSSPSILSRGMTSLTYSLSPRREGRGEGGRDLSKVSARTRPHPSPLSQAGEGVKPLVYKRKQPKSLLNTAQAAIQNIAFKLSTLALAATLAACTTVGPNYQPPTPTLPATYLQTAGFESAQVDAAFWQRFNDPQLNALVEQAKKANPDIRLALARLNEVRANLQGAQAAGLPTLNLSATVTEQLRSTVQQPGASRDARQGSYASLGASLAWELDLFGRVQRGVQAAQGDLRATEADLRAAHVAVAAEVASNYLQLRGLQARQVALNRNLDSQRETARLIDAKLRAGAGTELDQARQQTLIATTQASLGPVVAAIDRALLRLATLTGVQPAASDLMREPVVPTPPAVVGIGQPADLLRRRPDLARAEASLAAATARVGVTTGELYPSISIGARAGVEGAGIGELGRGGAFNFSFGPSITWAALDLGRTRARIAASEARADQALISFDKALLVALEETEGALSSYRQSLQTLAAREAAHTAAQRAADLAQKRFAAGAGDTLSLLDAQRQALDAQATLAGAQADVGIALVAVFRALGGGWQ